MESASVKPVYVLHGGDEFLRDLHRQEIIALAVDSADPQTCVTIFDAEATLAEVLDELRTLPFLAPRRVVILREADAFITEHRQALESYLQSPSTSGVLVLMVGSWSRSTRLYKLVGAIGQTFDCSADGRGVRVRLADMARQAGKKLSPQAAELLIESVGPDLALLSSEVQKLSAYVGDSQTISPSDVEAVVASASAVVAFELTNAITAGQADRALKALEAMLGARGEEFRVLGQIAWHLRRAVQARAQLDTGGNVGDAIGRMPPTQKAAFMQMLRRRPMSTLHNDLRRLIRADLLMKTGTSPKAAMQELVVALCN